MRTWCNGLQTALLMIVIVSTIQCKLARRGLGRGEEETLAMQRKRSASTLSTRFGGSIGATKAILKMARLYVVNAKAVNEAAKTGLKFTLLAWSRLTAVRLQT